MVDTHTTAVQSSASVLLPVADATPKDKEYFSRDYVHELREENKNWRLKTQQHEKAVDDIKVDMERLQKETQAKLSQEKQSFQARIIRAELKAQALAAGIIDLDGLKLADISMISLSDEGDIVGADDVIATLKEAKPYLFKEFKSSTSITPLPPEKPVQPKLAREMSNEEYRKAKQQLIWRNK